MLKHIVDVKMKGKGMRMYQVSKRDGQIAPFNLSKISVAIEKAFKAQDKEYNQDIIDLLALKVTADFAPKVKNSLIQVEDIQDSVENILIKAGYAMWQKDIFCTESSEKRFGISIQQCWIIKRSWTVMSG